MSPFADITNEDATWKQKNDKRHMALGNVDTHALMDC